MDLQFHDWMRLLKLYANSSRHDICSEQSGCTLMGLAYVAAACDPSKAAAINEDSGLLLGIVVAHEVGHVYVILLFHL